MGHREDLLTGAKRCLFERGYARTTARDIVAASGTNLASIGYHFGSKEALMTQALIEALMESTAHFEQNKPVNPTDSPLTQLHTSWGQLAQSVTTDRHLWLATIEAFLVSEHNTEVRQVVGDLYQALRQEVAAEFRHLLPESSTAQKEQALGALLVSILAGFTLQLMIDPVRAPDETALVDGLRLLLSAVEKNRPED